MRVLCFAWLYSFSGVCALGQIIIDHAHLPDAGDSLVTFSAQLESNVDFTLTGENYSWDFQDAVIANNQNPSLQCASLSNLSFFNLIYFQNPSDQEYYSDYGIGVDAFEVPNFGITVENAYQIYKNSGGVYAITGQVATINSIPVSAKFEDRNVIYDIPLSYGMSGNSNSELLFDVPTVLTYKTEQTRSYECDGWGTLNMCGQSFDVLRVRTVQNGVDTITASLFPIPFGIERPETITYEWLSTSFNVPVLSISTADLQTTVNVAPVCDAVGVEPTKVTLNTVKAYPTPTTDFLFVDGIHTTTPCALYDSGGQLVQRDFLNPGIPLSVSHLPSGLYLLQVEQEHGESLLKVSKH